MTRETEKIPEDELYELVEVLRKTAKKNNKVHLM